MGVGLLQDRGKLSFGVLQLRALVVAGLAIVERGARRFAGDLAVRHHEDAIGRGQQLGELGGDHEYRLAARGEIAHQRDDLGLGADVDAARRLIEDEDVRLGVEPFADDDLLLIAARERADSGIPRGGLDPQGLDLPIRRRRPLRRGDESQR